MNREYFFCACVSFARDEKVREYFMDRMFWALRVVNHERWEEI